MRISKCEESGVPYGSRTRVAAVKGRCPRPLDERDVSAGAIKTTVRFAECQISKRARSKEQRAKSEAQWQEGSAEGYARDGYRSACVCLIWPLDVNLAYAEGQDPCRNVTDDGNAQQDA